MMRLWMGPMGLWPVGNILFHLLMSISQITFKNIFFITIPWRTILSLIMYVSYHLTLFLSFSVCPLSYPLLYSLSDYLSLLHLSLSFILYICFILTFLFYFLNLFWNILSSFSLNQRYHVSEYMIHKECNTVVLGRKGRSPT